jgi:transcriptional regulator with XRE-family HTH domain
MHVMNELLPGAEAPDPTPEQLVGRHVRALRQEHGWSQQDVAARMRAYGYRWSQATVTRLETASRPIRVNELADLAMLFGVPKWEFLEPQEDFPWDDREAVAREIGKLLAERFEIKEHLDNQIAMAEEAARGRAAVAAHLSSIDDRLEALTRRLPQFKEIAKGHGRVGDPHE